MSETFFTSDWHLFHKKIIKYCPDSRQFDSVEEMNEQLIERHNAVVKPNDEVYNLGDFSFGNCQQTEDVLSRLNGNIHKVLGNHDAILDNSSLQKYFKSITKYKELPMKKFGVPIVLFHFPIEHWNRRNYGSLHFHGHCHANSIHHKISSIKNRMDVGVDTRSDCSPWSWDEIKEKLGKAK